MVVVGEPLYNMVVLLMIRSLYVQVALCQSRLVAEIVSFTKSDKVLLFSSLVVVVAKVHVLGISPCNQLESWSFFVCLALCQFSFHFTSCRYCFGGCPNASEHKQLARI